MWTHLPAADQYAHRTSLRLFNKFPKYPRLGTERINARHYCVLKEFKRRSRCPFSKSLTYFFVCRILETTSRPFCVQVYHRARQPLYTNLTVEQHPCTLLQPCKHVSIRFIHGRLLLISSKRHGEFSQIKMFNLIL